MQEYHKIDSVYKRDERGKFLIGEFSRPEFEYLKDLPWQWTEKIDGTNIRVLWQSSINGPTLDPPNDAFAVYFGGKTDNAQIPSKLVTYLMDTFFDEKMLEVFGETKVCLYGEGYGAGIQKGGGNYSPDQKFILFDVKIGDWWLERKNVEDIASKLGIDTVPLIGNATLTDMIRSVQSQAGLGLEEKSLISLTANREGYVGTPAVPLFARNGDRIITKIKYKDFR